MNIFQKYKEEKKYISLLKHHRELDEEFKRMEKESIDNICEYIEQITKTTAYKNHLLNGFRQDPYESFTLIARVSIMIQSLNEKSERLAAEYYDEIDRDYYYDSDTFNFDNETIDTYIKEIFNDLIYEQSLDDAYYFTIDLSCKSRAQGNYFNSFVNLIKTETEYVNDGNYEFVYYLDSRYEKGIRALYQCLLEIKEDMKGIMLEHIDEGRVEYYGQ